MEIISDEEYLVNDSTIGVANYFISLYERTKTRYHYYPTKINRLLTIYKLCTLKYNENCLFDSYFVINEDGTMGMKGRCYSSSYYFRVVDVEENYNEITDDLQSSNENKNYLTNDTKLIYDMFHKEYLNDDVLLEDYKKTYEEQLCISEESKELIELIFRKFGNYPYSKLAKQINQIVNNIPIEKNLFKICIMEKRDFDYFMNKNKLLLNHNTIFKFIKNFDRNDILIDINVDKPKLLKRNI